MKKLHLDFLMAFSKMEGKSEFMSDLINEAAEYLNNESYMKTYIASYNFIRDYHLEDEIRYLMSCGCTFLDVCLKLDILDEINAN